MKVRNKLMVLPIILTMFLLPSCKGMDVEDVAMVIEGASAVAYNEVINNNPELAEPIANMAKTSMQLLNGECIDVLTAKQLLRDALSNFSSLDEDDKRIIVDMFAVVMPLINLPESGALPEPHLTFVRAFFQGILNAVQVQEDLKTDEEVEDILAMFFR